MIMFSEKYSMITVNNKTNKWPTSYSKRLSNKQTHVPSKNSKMTKIKFKFDHFISNKIVFLINYFLFITIFLLVF